MKDEYFDMYPDLVFIFEKYRGRLFWSSVQDSMFRLEGTITKEGDKTKLKKVLVKDAETLDTDYRVNWSLEIFARVLGCENDNVANEFRRAMKKAEEIIKDVEDFKKYAPPIHTTPEDEGGEA